MIARCFSFNWSKDLYKSRLIKILVWFTFFIKYRDWKKEGRIWACLCSYNAISQSVLSWCHPSAKMAWQIRTMYFRSAKQVPLRWRQGNANWSHRPCIVSQRQYETCHIVIAVWCVCLCILFIVKFKDVFLSLSHHLCYFPIQKAQTAAQGRRAND